MNKSVELERILKARCVPPARFVWGDSIDKQDPLRGRTYLTHTQPPLFFCEIVENPVALRPPLAPVEGGWSDASDPAAWVCEEFIAFQWHFLDHVQPSRETLHVILLEAVRSFRAYHRDNAASLETYRQLEGRPTKPGELH